jgi:glucose-6-phosphate dehydrogenase assembly protein OpcA
MTDPVRAESDTVWNGQGTTPAEIEAALEEMLIQRCGEADSYVPARALNVVYIVEKQWKGEIANRVREVGGFHASRNIACAVEPRRTSIDAIATMSSNVHPGVGEFALLRETVIIDVGEQHLPYLDTIVGPLLVRDVPTILWSPHGHREAVDVLLPLADVVLLDSIDEPDVREALHQTGGLLQNMDVVDLAWLRSTPWRERIAATFDPPQLRPELHMITAISVRYHPMSGAAGLLLVGWLASRLDWRLSPLLSRLGAFFGSARAHRTEVRIALEPVSRQFVRGLAGLTLETASGRCFSLDRGPGGLQARYRNARGDDRQWTVLGASRGEPGILGEGIQHALERDPTYGPALAAALELVR